MKGSLRHQDEKNNNDNYHKHDRVAEWGTNMKFNLIKRTSWRWLFILQRHILHFVIKLLMKWKWSLKPQYSSFISLSSSHTFYESCQ